MLKLIVAALLMVLKLLFASFIAVGCSNPPAPKPVMQPKPELERVDVFGSKYLDRAGLIARFGDDLVLFVNQLESDKLDDVKDALEAKIKASGKFALVDVSVITYFQPRASYVTVDLVDEDDPQRMAFGKAPTGTHADPDGLIALWHEYQEKAMGMLMDGTIKPSHEPCPFWHCLTFGHESLLPYRDAFAKRAPAQENELAAILQNDRDAKARASAAFLLAHIASGERVVELMLPAITDSSMLVRNNAMRVLALIATDHKEIAIPVAPIIAALQFPLTTDRNKAAAILAGIAKHDTAAHAKIKAGAGTLLVEMLGLRQPNNHDYAYEILKSISGRDLGERDLAAWRAWLAARG